MKKILFVIVIMAIGLKVYAFDDLWKKAQSYAEKSWNLVPGVMTQTNIMKDQKTDEVNMNMYLKIAIKQNDFGFIDNELIEATVNDQKVDENTPEIKKLIEVDRTPSRKGMFLIYNKDDITIKKLRETSEINGIKVSKYEVKYSMLDNDNKKQTLEGIVWLDSQNGRPVLSDMKMAKTPMFVQSIDIKTYYGFNNNTETFFQEKVEMDVQISAMGQKISNNTVIEMRNYWTYN